MRRMISTHIALAYNSKGGSGGSTGNGGCLSQASSEFTRAASEAVDVWADVVDEFFFFFARLAPDRSADGGQIRCWGDSLFSLVLGGLFLSSANTTLMGGPCLCSLLCFPTFINTGLSHASEAGRAKVALRSA